MLHIVSSMLQRLMKIYKVCPKGFLNDINILKNSSFLCRLCDVKGYRLLLKLLNFPRRRNRGIILTESYKKLERRSYNRESLKWEIWHFSLCLSLEENHFVVWEIGYIFPVMKKKRYILAIICAIMSMTNAYTLLINNIEMIIKELR